MNHKLAVAMFTLPLGISFLLAKSTSAAEVPYQPDAHKPVLVAQSNVPQNHKRTNNVQRPRVPGHSVPQGRNGRPIDARYHDARVHQDLHYRGEVYRGGVYRGGVYFGEIPLGGHFSYYNETVLYYYGSSVYVWIPAHYESDLWVEAHWEITEASNVPIPVILDIHTRQPRVCLPFVCF